MSESDMLEGRNPFLWEGSSREAVLCIHGFVGSPGVFRKLGRMLHAASLTVCAPLLPGHGTTPEDLKKVTAEQMLGAVEQVYIELASKYNRVHLAGLSLGGTLATLLAANHAGERTLGCVSLFSPGYGFNKLLVERLGLDKWTDSTENESKMIPIPKRAAQDDEMDECIFGYDSAPLKVFGPVIALNKAALDIRDKVTAPVLLLYTEADTVVDAEACTEAVELFPNLVEAFNFREGEHNLLLGCDRKEAMQKCMAFIGRHRS